MSDYKKEAKTASAAKMQRMGLKLEDGSKSFTDERGGSPFEGLNSGNAGQMPVGKQRFKRGGKVAHVMGEKARKNLGKSTRRKRDEGGGIENTTGPNPVPVPPRKGDKKYNPFPYLPTKKQIGDQYAKEHPDSPTDLGASSSYARGGKASKHTDEAQDKKLMHKVLKKDAFKRPEKSSGGLLGRYIRGASMDAANSGYKEGLDTGSSIVNPAHRTMFPDAPRKTTNRLQGIRTAVAKMGGPGSYGVKVPATDDGMKKGGRTKKADGGPTEMTALQQLIKKGEDAGTRAGEKLAAQRRLQAQGKMSPNREAAMARGDMSGPNLNYFDKPFKMRAAGGSTQIKYPTETDDYSNLLDWNKLRQKQKDSVKEETKKNKNLNLVNQSLTSSGLKRGGKAMHHEDCSCKMCSGGMAKRSKKFDGGGITGMNPMMQRPGTTQPNMMMRPPLGQAPGMGQSPMGQGPFNPMGNRPMRASGGRAKGKTNVNIIISPQSGQPQGPLGAGVGMGQPPVPPMMPPTPPMGGMPPGMPPMMPPGMPPAPPMGGAPGGGLPPQLMAALAGRGGMPPMPRKSGGRVGNVMPKYQEEDYGSGSGLGRLEKRKWPTANGTE